MLKTEKMDIPALVNLMQKVEIEIDRKRKKLEGELSVLTKIGKPVTRAIGGGSHLKGVKVKPKYRGPKGETWAGRGAVPRWMRAAMKATGKKREAFLIKVH